MLERFFGKTKEIKETESEILEKEPEVISENEVTNLENGDPDFMAFGKGTMADLTKKIQEFMSSRRKSKDAKKIKEIEDSVKNPTI